MDYNHNRNRGMTVNQINPFAVASFICGILSILLCCTGIFSVPAGALGILFAVMAKRAGQPLPSLCVTGIALCITGILMGILLLSYSLYLIKTDPAMRELFMQYYREVQL